MQRTRDGMKDAQVGLVEDVVAMQRSVSGLGRLPRAKTSVTLERAGRLRNRQGRLVFHGRIDAHRFQTQVFDREAERLLALVLGMNHQHCIVKLSVLDEYVRLTCAVSSPAIGLSPFGTIVFG